MEIKFRILYREEVLTGDIPKLSHDLRKRIQKDIEKKLMTFPHLFGKPLAQSLFGFRKLRVGNYRVIFEIVLPDIVIIRAILHRSVIYKTATRRLMR